MHQGYQAYKRSGIETASPSQLLLALYDGAIRFLGRAQNGLEKNDLAVVNENLARTQAIIMELIATLDMDQGEIPQRLMDLYIYLQRALMDANTQKDGAKIAEVEGIVRKLREAWRGAIQQVNRGTAARTTLSTGA
ncbi:MAG: flagellar export chaperone FliS [Dehalococcoidia bacterium]